jgi:hypothetical protein
MFNSLCIGKKCFSESILELCSLTICATDNDAPTSKATGLVTTIDVLMMRLHPKQ